MEGIDIVVLPHLPPSVEEGQTGNLTTTSPDGKAKVKWPNVTLYSTLSWHAHLAGLLPLDQEDEKDRATSIVSLFQIAVDVDSMNDGMSARTVGE